MEPLVVGNAVSLVKGAVYIIVLILALDSQNFDWGVLKTNIRAMDDSDVNGVTSAQIPQQSSSEKLSLEDESALLHT
jgi:hypothetical protein